MLVIRRAEDRFHTDFGWLDSWHTFSFGEHYDPAFQGFRDLLVINDDRVAAGGGFPTHGHRDMEIISYVVDGALGHKDSMGNGSVIRPGDVQRMSAGTGVRHSEMNADAARATHFLQIWILPDGVHNPSYEQKAFTADEKRDVLKLVASGRSAEGALAAAREAAVKLHQKVDLYASMLSAGKRVEHTLDAGRYAWVHVVKGGITLNGEAMKTGDGAALGDIQKLTIEAQQDTELLVFDLA